MLLFLLISAVLTLIALIYLIAGGNDLKKWQTLALVIVSPLLVAVIYAQIGTPKAVNLEKQLTASTHDTNDIDDLLSRSQLSPEQVQRAIDSLRAKVNENPEDIESLNLLATTYLISDQTQLAVLTLEKLISLGQTDADTLVKTADAYAFVEQGNINLRAKQLLENAMAKDPNHPQGLWLSGMAAMQSGEPLLARDAWQRLLPLVANTPQEAALQDILKQFNELDAHQDFINSHGAEIITEESSELIPKTDAQTTTKEATAKEIVNDSKLELKIEVSLADGLREDNPTINDEDTVFVFAKAANGPPAPLAVKRLRVADLPITVILTEQDAMLPQMTINQFADIQISAKISKSGNPTVKDNDIESNIIATNTTALQEDYQLIISQTVQ